MHQAMRAMGAGSLAPSEPKEKGEKPDEEKKKRPPIGYQSLAFMLESQISWGDVGMWLDKPGGGLGAAAIVFSLMALATLKLR